jgi:hypothetical protein
MSTLCSYSAKAVRASPKPATAIPRRREDRDPRRRQLQGQWQTVQAAADANHRGKILGHQLEGGPHGLRAFGEQRYCGPPQCVGSVERGVGHSQWLDWEHVLAL